MNDNTHPILRIPAGATDDDLIQVMARFSYDGVSVEEICELTRCLALSGDQLSFPEGIVTADIASTGGPASLSTLLCPLFLASGGAWVPKIGVPGRPAGGIDVLAQIGGYNISLPPSSAQRVVERVGYCHFIAGSLYAPLDARLFSLRQSRGAQGVPSLVVASLLAKKLAAGVRMVGLDVRVSPFGNFGETLDQARQNAVLFCTVGKALGLTCSCFLTDGTRPPQPYLGRGEALLALDAVFSGNARGWLTAHLYVCERMASQTVGRAASPDRGELAEIFLAHVEAQGGSKEAFAQKVENVRSQPIFEITARKRGFVGYDLAAFRSVLTELQGLHRSERDPFPDPGGIILQIAPGTFVERDEVVAVVRLMHGQSAPTISAIQAAIHVDPDPGYPTMFELIS